jgi:hypothetical protein
MVGACAKITATPFLSFAVVRPKVGKHGIHGGGQLTGIAKAMRLKWQTNERK